MDWVELYRDYCTCQWVGPHTRDKDTTRGGRAGETFKHTKNKTKQIQTQHSAFLYETCESEARRESPLACFLTFEIMRRSIQVDLKCNGRRTAVGATCLVSNEKTNCHNQSTPRERRDRERSGGVCDLFEKAARKWTCGEQSCMIAGPFPVPIGEKNKGPTIWRADLEERGQDVLHGRERRGGEGVERVNQCDFPLFHHGF